MNKKIVSFGLIITILFALPAIFAQDKQELDAEKTANAKLKKTDSNQRHYRRPELPTARKKNRIIATA